MLTRSTVILDLDSPGPDDTVVFCPANHSPPMLVAPYPGARGYEAVASCLAPPDVRARTEGFAVVRASQADAAGAAPSFLPHADPTWDPEVAAVSDARPG